MDIHSHKKRRIEGKDTYGSFDNTTGGLPPTGSGDQASLASTPTMPNPELTHSIIHNVRCDRTSRYHQHHEPNANYFGVPFLAAESNRMTGLSGERRLANLDDYLEDHVNLSFVVYMTYDCVAYHDTIKDNFERLIMPHMDENNAYQTKPYFYVLRQDAEPAKPQRESLILSDRLRMALENLEEVHENMFGKPGRGGQGSTTSLTNPVYPYIELYHQKQNLVENATLYLTSDELYHINVLSNYLENHVGPEYDEAEELFNVGHVNKKHWTKLYTPGTVVTENRSSEPTAYILTACTTTGRDSVHLKCWSWAFDGKFFKNEVTFVVSWPSDKDTVEITDLLVYPLKCAPTGLEKELRDRGETFWSCRSRKFINYTAPLQGMEVQIVGSSVVSQLHTFLMLAGQFEIHGRRCNLQANAWRRKRRRRRRRGRS